MCSLNTTEDEFHFIAECPAYNILRNDLESNLSNTPNVMLLNKENKAIWLLTNENKTICKALGKFIHESLKLRRQNQTTLG
jgi:hypothetical protein